MYMRTKRGLNLAEYHARYSALLLQEDLKRNKPPGAQRGRMEGCLFLCRVVYRDFGSLLLDYNRPSF